MNRREISLRSNLAGILDSGDPILITHATIYVRIKGLDASPARWEFIRHEFFSPTGERAAPTTNPFSGQLQYRASDLSRSRVTVTIEALPSPPERLSDEEIAEMQ